MSIESVMKSNIGKQFLYKGRKVEIVSCFSCYEGDYYEYRDVDLNTEIQRVKLFTEEGYKFEMNIPK